MKAYVKDPDAKLDYSVNWNPFLVAAGGDTISSSSWVSSPAGLTITDLGVVDGYHSAYVEGGTLNSQYTVTSRVTTAAGRINDTSFVLLIRAT